MSLPTPYWRSDCGRYTIFCGDCLDILPHLSGVDAVVVADAPYALGFPYADYDDTPANLEALAPAVVAASRAVADRVVLFPGVHNLWKYPPADWLLSWSWRCTSHFGKAGYSMWQPILMYGKDMEGFGNINGHTKTDSVHFPDGNGIGFLGEDRADHPCPKPVKVMRWLVERFSRETDTIIDPFAGSGTTGVACVKTERRFIGIELSEKYCAIAKRRIMDEANHLFAGNI